MFSLDLNQKISWVTGGSRGLGRAIALALGKAGSQVAISYLKRAEEAEKVVDEIKTFGQSAIAVQLDVSKPEAVSKAHELIVSFFQNDIDILVNNAGIISDNLFLMLEDEDWHRLYEVNLLGLVNTTKLVAPKMMMKKWGRIINISSSAATKGGRGQSNYAATKGAIEAMTRSLAVEFASKNITVNCLAPGVLDTEMSKEIRTIAPQEILNRLLIKRYAQPEEIAPWVLMLASEYGAYITGQVINIDGGLKMP